MSQPICRYIPSEKPDHTAEVLQMVVYPDTHPEYGETVVIDTAKSFNEALHVTAAMNHASLMNLSHKIGTTTVNTTPSTSVKNKYRAGDKQWDVNQLLQDIRDNEFMLRLDNHTTFISNYSNQRKVSEVTMVHYKSQVMELATNIEGVQTITLNLGDEPSNATMKRVNCVLRHFDWELRRYTSEDAFGDKSGAVKLREITTGWYIDLEDGMYIDPVYGNVYSPDLDNIIQVLPTRAGA